MRALIQRVSHASVVVGAETVGGIGPGLLVLLGVAGGDSHSVADRLLHKVLNYRVFTDGQGKMNLSLLQTQGELLIVSQFTLMADTGKGLRPGFSVAAAPAQASELYDYFVASAKHQYAPDRIQTGRFAADMKVALLNDGPVTFLLEVNE